MLLNLNVFKLESSLKGLKSLESLNTFKLESSLKSLKGLKIFKFKTFKFKNIYKIIFI